jgi:hypothetical protein
MAGTHEDESAPRNLTRRDVIKGVIAAGAVSSAGYMFRSSGPPAGLTRSDGETVTTLGGRPARPYSAKPNDDRKVKQ